MSLRKRYLYWGATAAEIERVMPGDAAIPEATYDTTLGITIDAPAADIWPWLVQMGYRRGGLYSYDWLDRLFGFLDAPSAERVLPEHQRLAVGDVIPIGRGDRFSRRCASSRCARWCSPARPATVSAGCGSSGCIHSTQRRTRLVSRNRARLPRTLGSDPVHVRPRTGRVHHDARDAARPQAPGGAPRNGET